MENLVERNFSLNEFEDENLSTIATNKNIGVTPDFCRMEQVLQLRKSVLYLRIASIAAGSLST